MQTGLSLSPQDGTFIHFYIFFSTTVLAGLGLGDHTVTHNTANRTPLDEWPARRRDLYLTTNNNHKREKAKTSSGFEPEIPASERLQTHAWDRQTFV
jgi:hypothetical protein